jgi:hypothetical protein
LWSSEVSFSKSVHIASVYVQLSCMSPSKRLHGTKQATVSRARYRMTPGMLNVFCLTSNSELRAYPPTLLLYTPGRGRSKFPDTREHPLLPPVTIAAVLTVKRNNNNGQSDIAQFYSDIEFLYFGKVQTFRKDFNQLHRAASFFRS